MSQFKQVRQATVVRSILAVVMIAVASQMTGCGLQSFMDPSKTGYFKDQPTMVPILDRIDVIEQEETLFRQTSEVTREDLLPSDLTYRLAPGDFVTVEVFELEFDNQMTQAMRRIDASGNFRLPVVGDVPAAGKTLQEFQDDLVELLAEEVLAYPQVTVQLEEGGYFQYTVYGNTRGPGVYQLRRPDFRLLEALATAGGVPPDTQTIYVIRQVALDDEVIAPFYRDMEDPDRPRDPDERRPVDIDELIDQLDEEPRPGAMSQSAGHDDPPIDIDDLQPVRVADEPPVDIEDMPAPTRRERDSNFVYDEERGEWVEVRPGTGEEVDEDEAYVERIIEIPYDRLEQGDSRYNIVIRPSDKIFVEFPEMGLVYVEGEVARPGVYSLAQEGGQKLTLSRLIAAVGGLGPVAIPERVDLTRMVGENREATIRVNLAAIRQRTEPDIVLKPNDHIIVGTSFAATPLAVIRNGFRVSYGFGFLLDRNFGNDVFGAPPTRVQGQ